MRLFAAVVPPDPVLDELEMALSAVDLSRVRPVPRHQQHVTVAFYGEVRESVVDELVDRLARAAKRSAPFTLRLRGAGAFPRQSMRARQLWVGLDGDVADLARLVERAVAAGRRCGLPMADRPYRPHLTLGRSRGGPADLRAEVSALASYDGRSWPVTSVRLVHSTLGATVIHTDLVDLPFA